MSGEDSGEEQRGKLERLKAVRRGHRGVLTKLTREIEEILSNSELNSEATSRLLVIHEQLEGKRKVISNLDSEIVGICVIDEIEREIEESEAITAKIIQSKRKINAAIATTSRESVAHAVPPPPSGEASTKPRLPKLSLPKFRGDVTTWSAFWDSYRSAVHENTSIAVVDKFNYLNSLLEGPAARTIQGLTLNEDNYGSAVKLLQDRFGRPQQIISAHMEELLKISPCVGDKPSSLRYVYDKINVNIRGLSAMGISSTQYGSLLIPIIMTKLTPELRLRIARETKKEVWEIGELLTLIKQEVEAREATEMVKVPSMKPTGMLPARGNRPLSNPTANALFTRNSSVQCVYCNEDHYSASCKKVTGYKERKEILLQSGRCFNCLKTNHKSRDCDSHKTCRHCHRKHHQSICNQVEGQENKNTGQTPGNQEDGQPPGKTTTTTTATSTFKNQQTVLLQTARAMAYRDIDGSSVPVRVLFDSGSQLSYITDKLQTQLQLKPVKIEKLLLNTFGTRGYKTQACNVVKLYLQGLEGVEKVSISALTSPVICSPLPSAVKIARYPHLGGLQLADDYSTTPGEIDVLIGSNFYWSVVTGDTLRGDHGPVAVNSKLGWLLSGAVDTMEARQISHAHVVITGDPANPLQEDDVLVNSLRRFWEVESFGIVDPSSTSSESTLFLPSLVFENSHYEVGLPWKNIQLGVPNHLSLCENRLRSLLRRLQTQPRMLSEYDNIIREQLRQGIVEYVGSQEKPKSFSGDYHYLPHHGVIRQDSETTKLRIVYDGSAKAVGDEYSLNDYLLTGPNSIPKLFNILIQFRWNPVAITADIEKAFLMISIKPSDRDFLRFLWIKDTGKPQSELIHLRFTRLVFGLRPSPAVLGAVLNHHISKYLGHNSTIAEKLQMSLYVDDLVTSTPDIHSAYEFYLESRKIMAAGGMNLRKWHSNSSELLDKIESSLVSTSCNASQMTTGVTEEDNTYVKTMIGPNVSKQSQGLTKVLGVTWNSSLDVFTFEFDELIEFANSLLVNKCSILKLAAKIFDPLGLISPFVIQLKMLFQILCIQQVNWDDPLSSELLTKWRNILSQLHCLNSVQVPRCYFGGDPCTTRQLHGFCDASDRAFAAVVYLRSVYDNNCVKTVLIASKTRVAPVKKQSIPRLELLGAVTLSRLMATIMASLPEPVPTFYWTDSTATLHWISNQKPWRQYIEHRVSEIRRLSDSQLWHHCPGNLNPADVPSRGMNGEKLAACDLWWKGPEFLYQREDQWPDMCNIPASDITNAELIKKPTVTTHILLSAGCNKRKFPMLDEIIDCTRYSKLDKLLGVTAYVLRFVNILRLSNNGDQGSTHNSKQLIVEEIDNAEKLWIRSLQAKSFLAELAFLQSQSKQVPPVRIHQFGLFIDHAGLLRCRGRVNNAILSTATKNPILLPTKHPWINLLISHVHQRVKHSGITDTLSTIREKFWILRGRQAVKRVIKCCIVCNKLEGMPYSSVMPPDLPSFRVSEDPPFTYTGIDFAGPMYLREASAQDASTSKAYICLFICCSTRAIHLEMSTDLSVSSFLLLFRRFASRRGLPVTLISDNAKTFKAASKDIVKIARSAEVTKFLNSHRVSWKFIVEKAPWWGGFWERLIRSIKRSLKKSIGRGTLNYEELNTILIEVEAIINSRPLTYVLDDQGGISDILTPSHLINGRRISTMPNDQHFEIVSTYQSLTKRAKHHKHLLTQFTRQWRREYLLNLREIHSVKVKHGQHPSIAKGDVVVVKDDASKRLFWKLGVVQDLITGDDQQVRAAVVKVSDPKGHTSLLRRSVRHLYPIEVRDENIEDVPTTEEESLSVSQVDSNRRPRREAARRGEESRRKHQ